MAKKIHFSGQFHGWIWPLSDLKHVTIGQMWRPLCPQWGILMGRLVYTGFWVHWIEKIGRNWEKSQKIDFSGIFHGWIWPFPDLKPVPIGQKWYSLCPQWGILMGKFVPKGFWVHWTQKIGRIWEKVKNLIFRTSFQAIMVTSRLKKSDLNAQFWCSLGPWWGIGICKVVSQCLFMFSRQLEGSKMTSTKICHFSLISIR